MSTIFVARELTSKNESICRGFLPPLLDAFFLSGGLKPDGAGLGGPPDRACMPCNSEGERGKGEGTEQYRSLPCPSLAGVAVPQMTAPEDDRAAGE